MRTIQILAGAVAVVIGWSFVRPSPESIVAREAPAGTSVPLRRAASTPPNDIDGCTSSEDSGAPDSVHRLRAISVENDAVDGLLASGFSAPGDLIAKAQAGSSNAAIAAFRLISSCFSPRASSMLIGSFHNAQVKSSLSNCPALPAELVGRRLQVLEDAAERGSAEAAYFYSLNAPSIAAVYRRQPSNEAAAYSEHIRERAAVFGDRAARAGIRNAAVLMSTYYINGDLGLRDPAKAFRYLKLIAQSEPEELNSADYQALLARLPADKRIRARPAGCSAAAGGALINPFGETISHAKVPLPKG